MIDFIGLRIDVDTVRGYKNGVIPLLNLLKRLNIKASFFIPTGYDTPFRTLPRFLKERGFPRRVFKLRKSFYYKILSSEDLALRKIIRQIRYDGHELNLHGYRHFDWQLQLGSWTQRRVEKEMHHAIENFKSLTGSLPRSFAAPGWVAKKEVFLAEENFNFDYCSDTRGISPFYPIIGNRLIGTLQIPVTLPTLDELIILGDPKNLLNIDVRGDDVYCAHAEFDGMRYIRIFELFLEKNLQKGYRFIPLYDMIRYLVKIPSSHITQRNIPGRTALVACQMRQQIANSKQKTGSL